MCSRFHSQKDSDIEYLHVHHADRLGKQVHISSFDRFRAMNQQAATTDKETPLLMNAIEGTFIKEP